MISEKLTIDDFHEGYLDKMRPKFTLFTKWQSRYFVLTNRMLKYYKSQEEYFEQKAPKGVINFNQVSVN